MGDCQHWHWTINILKFIPMQKYDFYAVNRSVPADKGPNHTVYCIDNDKVCTVPVYSTMAFTMPPEHDMALSRWSCRQRRSLSSRARRDVPQSCGNANASDRLEAVAHVLPSSGAALMMIQVGFGGDTITNRRRMWGDEGFTVVFGSV